MDEIKYLKKLNKMKKGDNINKLNIEKLKSNYKFLYNFNNNLKNNLNNINNLLNSFCVYLKNNPFNGEQLLNNILVLKNNIYKSLNFKNKNYNFKNINNLKESYINLYNKTFDYITGSYIKVDKLLLQLSTLHLFIQKNILNRNNFITIGITYNPNNVFPSYLLNSNSKNFNNKLLKYINNLV